MYVCIYVDEDDLPFLSLFSFVPFLYFGGICKVKMFGGGEGVSAFVTLLYTNCISSTNTFRKIVSSFDNMSRSGNILQKPSHILPSSTSCRQHPFPRSGSSSPAARFATKVFLFCTNKIWFHSKLSQISYHETVSTAWNGTHIHTLNFTSRSNT